MFEVLFDYDGFASAKFVSEEIWNTFDEKWREQGEFCPQVGTLPTKCGWF